MNLLRGLRSGASESLTETAVARMAQAGAVPVSVVQVVAEAGDVWLYATAIIHASEAARNPRRRRVLQVDYSAASLPGDLDWLGL